MALRESFARKVLRKFGWTIARNQTLRFKHQANYLRRLFRLLDVDLVLDVGGNVGQFARFLRRDVGYRGAIVTFEPIEALARRMKDAAARDPNWTIVNAAVGSEPSVRSLNIMASTPLSSFLSPSEERTTRLADINRVQDSAQVQVTTVDAILRQDHLTRFRNVYLKLDVQGFERECLQGARKSLEKIVALQAELPSVPIYSQMPPISP